MSRSVPLKIVDESKLATHDPDPSIPSSPKVPSSLTSSPQGAAPKPLATFSPISKHSTQANLVPNASNVIASKSIPEAGVALQPANCLQAMCKEDLNTPKARVNQDIEVPKSPTKKNLSEEKCQGLGSRKALFSTKGRQSKSSKAGLVMSVARVLRKLKDGQYSRRVGVTGAVYLASVLEYLVAEVLELAGNCARFVLLYFLPKAPVYLASLDILS